MISDGNRWSIHAGELNEAPISAPSPRSQNKLTISSYQNPFFRSKSNSFPGSPRRALRASVDHSKARSERPSTSSPQHRRAALKGSGCVWFLDQRHRLLHIYIYMYYRCSSVFMSGIIVCIYIYIQFQPLYGSMPRKHFTESFQPWSGMCCCQRWHFAKRSSNSHAWTNHKAGTVWKLGQQCGKYDPVQPQPKIFRLKLENMVPYWKDSRSDFWDYVPFSRVLRNNTSLLCAASTKALRFLQTNFHWRNIRPCFS